MTKFTPGPWEWLYAETHCDGVGRVVTAQVVDVPTNQCVVEFSNTSHSEIVYEGDGSGGGAFYDEQARANARLISAAPDMYEALKRLVEYYKGTTIEDDYALIIDQARAALSKAEGET